MPPGRGNAGDCVGALQAAGLDDEGDTPDGKLTIRYNTCLGACALAPVMSVDHHLAGRMTPDKGRELVAKTLDSTSSAAEEN